MKIMSVSKIIRFCKHLISLKYFKNKTARIVTVGYIELEKNIFSYNVSNWKYLSN